MYAVWYLYLQSFFSSTNINIHESCLTWLLSHFHSFNHYNCCKVEMIHPHPGEYLKYPGNFLWSMTSSWQYKHHKARDQHVYLVYRLLLVSCFGCHNIIIQCPTRHLHSMVVFSNNFVGHIGDLARHKQNKSNNCILYTWSIRLELQWNDRQLAIETLEVSCLTRKVNVVNYESII